MHRAYVSAVVFACVVIPHGKARGENLPDAISISTIDSPQWDCSTADPEFVYWRSAIGTNCGFPAIGKNRILIGTNNAHPRDKRVVADSGIMMCFDPGDGRFLWQTAHARVPNLHADLPFMAIACTPAIVGDRAFYMSNRGELVCVDLLGFSDGEDDGPVVGEQQTEHGADIVWILDLVKALGVYKQDSTDVGSPLPSPLVVGDSVFIVTGNGTNYDRVPAPAAPSFIAVDRSSGRLKWASAAPGTDIIRGQWGSPALVQVAGRQCVVFPGGDSRLHGLDPATGNVIWRLDCVNPHDGFGPRSLGRQPMFWSAPAVVGDMLYIGLGLTYEMRGSPRSKLFAIHLAEHGGSLRPKIVWEFHSPRFGGTRGTPADTRWHCLRAGGHGHCVRARRGQRPGNLGLRPRRQGHSDVCLARHPKRNAVRIGSRVPLRILARSASQLPRAVLFRQPAHEQSSGAWRPAVLRR